MIKETGTIRTRPDYVSADNVWETVQFLNSKVEQGMPKGRAIQLLQATIKLYCEGLDD